MIPDSSLNFNVNLTVTDGGFFDAGTAVDWSLKNHSAPISKFYYVTDGEFEITIEGKTYTAKAGDWFFIPARVEHSYHNFPGVPFKKYWMHFDLYPRKDIVKLLGINYYLPLSDRKKTDELFSRFSGLCISEDFGDSLLVKAIAFELMSIFIKSSRKNSERPVLDSTSEFSKIFSYIENNMSMKISNSALSAIAHMSPTHFIRYFKKETGQTPGEYINQRKMERAKYLLQSTELQICEISEQLGFYDTMHFSKAFKKRYSLSPTAYRKMYEAKI